MKRGETYDPNAATNEEEIEDPEENTIKPKRRKKNVPEQYLHKYEKHLGGLDVAKDAAKSTVDSNRSYGFGTSSTMLNAPFFYT